MRSRLIPILVPLLATGCLAAPSDRNVDSSRFRRPVSAALLESAVSKAPGVSRVSIRVREQPTRTMDVALDVSGATEQQVVDAVDLIIRERGDRFAGYEQKYVFKVAERAGVEAGARLVASDVAADTQWLAAVHRGLPDATLKLAATGGAVRSIQVNGADTGAVRAIAAIRSAGGRANAKIDSQLTSDVGVWTIAFPFSEAAERDVRGRIALMPVEAWSVGVGADGRIVDLDVGVLDPARAYEDVRRTIEMSGAGVGKPMWLYFQLAGVDPSETEGGPFLGRVQVAQCEHYPDDDPDDPASAAAIEVERRLRAEYDTCTR